MFDTADFAYPFVLPLLVEAYVDQWALGEALDVDSPCGAPLPVGAE